MKHTGLILLVLFLGLTGCSTLSTSVEGKADLRQYRRIYVQSSSNDSDHLDQMLVLELQRLGYRASAGVRTLMPDDTQVYLTYESSWAWDFHSYLIQLDVKVWEAQTDRPLAEGHIFHPGITPATPEQMMHEILAPLFGPKK